MVKNLPVNAGDIEMHFRSLGWEDPLEEGMATPSSILAWSIPWKEESGGLQSIGLHRVGHSWSDLACTYTWVFVWFSGKKLDGARSRAWHWANGPVSESCPSGPGVTGQTVAIGSFAVAQALRLKCELGEPRGFLTWFFSAL